MITSNSTAFAKSFEAVQKQIEQKLKNVVRGFAYKVTYEAIQNTPLGNSEQYFKMYERRQTLLGLNPEEGFARGSWQANQSGQFTIQSIYGVSSGSEAYSVVKTSLGNITLGETVYIGFRCPYIKLLEANHSPQTDNLGIMKPTQAAVMASYAIDIKKLYQEG